MEEINIEETEANDFEIVSVEELIKSFKTDEDKGK